MFYYDRNLDNCSDSTTVIYVSSCETNLPIVIDTGVGLINKSDLASLKQVNGTTPVSGQGNVKWDIEDFYGTRRLVMTEALSIVEFRRSLLCPI